MVNILELDRLYRSQWVVFDRSLRVVDHDRDLECLRLKHGGRRCTFFYVAG